MLNDCDIINFLKAKISLGQLDILRCSYEKKKVNRKHRKSKKITTKRSCIFWKIKVNQGGDTEV